MKSLHTLHIINKSGETLVIYFDSATAKYLAMDTLDAQGIDYTDNSSWGQQLTGSTDKQQASMLDTVKSWVG